MDSKSKEIVTSFNKYKKEDYNNYLAEREKLIKHFIGSDVPNWGNLIFKVN